VRVATPDGTREVHRVVGSGGSFGASTLELEIGLGTATAIEEVEIRWPIGGPPQVLRGFELDHTYRVREGASAPERLARSPIPFPKAHLEPDQHHASQR
jgi:ASPIC and UnbV